MFETLSLGIGLTFSIEAADSRRRIL